MFWMKFVTNFLKILRAGQTPKQIAGAFALGAIVGLSPILTLQGVVIWLVIFVLDVNLSAAFFSYAAFAMIGYLFDPLFHSLGYFLLVDVAALHGLWTYLYSAPIAPLSRFYNTVVLGSFVTGVILFVPVYFGMKKFVVAYRTHIHAKVEKWKIYQILNRSSMIKWYQRIRSLGVNA
ncbi:MAG: TIGR03546 family protein [Bacteroidetes bacterium]|nr:TIGR03546 family protein [Bacteroidota bacterium]